MTALQRLVITFGQSPEIRVLYRTTDGPGPSTKKRRREVERLARAVLERTLKALDAGEVADLGTPGFSTREDVLGLPSASSDSAKQMKRGAWWM